jgi:hypothetical protein
MPARHGRWNAAQDKKKPAKDYSEINIFFYDNQNNCKDSAQVTG